MRLSTGDEFSIAPTPVPTAPPRPLPLGLWALALGSAALAAPTLASVVKDSWSSEQGSHGPIVLMTGLWLVARLWREARPLFRRPPLLAVVVLLAPTLALLTLARIVHVLEVEGFILYAVLLVALYSVIGGPAMRRLWFPLLYLAFIFPLPDTLVAAVTLPLKTLISKSAITVLSAVGYPIGGAGVTIVVGPYELLVAAACSGLNSIISLSVIGLFYLYARHDGDLRRAWPAVALIVPIAILANFVRVIILILITYHAGDAAAQGFLHGFAGLSMFVVALALLVAVDAVTGAVLGGRTPRKRSDEAPAA